jgi:NADH:ubiquinone oxidoreductase subunit 4 (subunit M)
VLIVLIVVLGTVPDLFYGMIQDASEPVVALIGGGA